MNPSSSISSQNVQLNLHKVFKNLIVTKRQIMDLQKSISNVVQSMNRMDTYLARQRQQSINRIGSAGNIARITHNLNTINHSNNYSTDNSSEKTIKIQQKLNKKDQNQKLTPRNKLTIFKCLKCQKQFQHQTILINHVRQSHKFCRLCQSFYQQSHTKEIHLRTYCPEQRIPCLGCNSKIKRKNLQEHIQNCCYKMCFKCKEAIYVKAYGYHLQHCQKRSTWITQCKKFANNGNNDSRRDNLRLLNSERSSFRNNLQNCESRRYLLSERLETIPIDRNSSRNKVQVCIKLCSMK